MAYNEYSGQCVGRIIYFLYEYNRSIGELSYIGDGTISADPYCKEVIATYVWNNHGDGDIPWFTFTNKYVWLSEIQSRKYYQIVSSEYFLGKPLWSKKKLEEEKLEELRKRKENFIKQIKNSVPM